MNEWMDGWTRKEESTNLHDANGRKKERRIESEKIKILEPSNQNNTRFQILIF